MTWCNNSDQEGKALQIVIGDVSRGNHVIDAEGSAARMVTCPSCGQNIELQDQGTIHDLPGLPSGVKFDPSDHEIIEHLEAKAAADARKVHPLIDEFIPTLEGENGICYTHPEKLPGVSKEGQIRHFFHRPSKAYTTGTRKRRKVHGDADGGETRWHKTGKTRPVLVDGAVRGFKKILVLYTNYGRQRKPEKTNWVMHQYHLGDNEDEKDGELVMSKVFYQTQPRQCGSSVRDPSPDKRYAKGHQALHGTNVVDYYSYGNPNYMSNYDQVSQNRESPAQLIPNLVVQGGGSSFIQFSTDSSKGKLVRDRDGGGG